MKINIFLICILASFVYGEEPEDLLKTCRGTEYPPRVSHFNGLGAHGYFETASNPHPDIVKYTKARLFQGAASRTPLFIRFSMAKQDPVLPDAKGFSIRFYTDEGLFDLAGQHIFTFILSDVETFQAFIAASKMKKDPNNPNRDVDSFWTFCANHPQSLLHNLMLFTSPLADSNGGSLGYPSSFRFIGGGGIHTYKLTNEAGESVWTKFHWTPDQGQAGVSTSNETNLNAALFDLYDSIHLGNPYPSWQLSMQVMTMKQADELPLSMDSHDLTRMWPVDTFPHIPLGKIILNRNPDDFSDVEMIAFDPSKVPPGIDMSPPELDSILPLRIGAYAAMQSKRLPPGSKLVINAAKFNPKNKRCGASVNMYNGTVAVVMGKKNEENKNPNDKLVKKDRKVDYYAQASSFYKGLKMEDQKRLARNLASGLKGVSEETKTKTLDFFKNAHEQLSKDVQSLLK